MERLLKLVNSGRCFRLVLCLQTPRWLLWWNMSLNSLKYLRLLNAMRKFIIFLL